MYLRYIQEQSEEKLVLNEDEREIQISKATASCVSLEITTYCNNDKNLLDLRELTLSSQTTTSTS